MKAGSNRAVLHRYLLREAGGAWVAVTLVLLVIMLSTRFARFLAQAAAGELPRDLLFQVVALSSLQYLVILVPVSLMLAVMLALGRLYKDNEVAAMTACGAGTAALYRPFLTLGVALALFTGALAFQIGPWAGRTGDYLVKNATRFIAFNPFEPGRFKEVGGRATFYTETMSADGEKLGLVFARISEREGESLLIARRGEQVTDPTTGEREVRLFDGSRVQGEAGRADFSVMRFTELLTRIAPPDFIYQASKRKIRATEDLRASDDLEDRAELEWRIAAPVSVLILALLAIPLSHTGPREGRYGKLVIGIGAYLLYSQLLGVGQSWIASGKVNPLLGLWWVHAIFLTAALVMMGRRQGWFRR